ncbi:MAG: alpha/beta fold hydrolase [Alkalispirochaetaceae bacterium]
MDYKIEGSAAVQTLLIPGGPGLPPAFYKELTDQLAQVCEVITYAPRGSQDPATDDYPRSVAEYVEECEAVVTAAADPGKPLILLGQSFGAAVALEMLARGHAASGALLINGFDSTEMLARGLQARREALPEAFHAAYRQLSGDNLAELLPLLSQYFYPKHFCRLDPWPDSFLSSLGSLNLKLAEYWLGPDLFEAKGALDGWSRTEDLGSIDIPVLVVSGANDYYLEVDNRRFADALPQGELWLSEIAGHTPWVEDPQPFFERVREFIGRVG